MIPEIIGEAFQIVGYRICGIQPTLRPDEVAAALSAPFIRPEFLALPCPQDVVITHFDSNTRGENAHVERAAFQSDSDVWSSHGLHKPIMTDKR